MEDGKQFVLTCHSTRVIHPTVNTTVGVGSKIEFDVISVHQNIESQTILIVGTMRCSDECKYCTSLISIKDGKASWIANSKNKYEYTPILLQHKKLTHSKIQQITENVYPI